MTLPRNQWPASLMGFLLGQSTVTVEEIGVIALRSPHGCAIDAGARDWITAALASLRWRRGKGGSIWRKSSR